MYSEKLERIPNDKSQALKTSLSRAESNDAYVRRRELASKTGLDEATVQTILSELVNSDVLTAKVQIRCHHCVTQHGIYSRIQDIPQETKRCFECGTEIDVSNERNWEVIYEVTGPPGDFFRGSDFHIKYFLDESRNLSPEFFVQEFQRFQDVDNFDRPQERGRNFDYLMGLLFQQLPDVEIRIKEEGNTGEIDIHMNCLNAAKWIHRLVGAHTLIENKWEKDPIQKKEVDNFHSKASEIHNCNIAYFASMSGFSRGNRKQTGALANLRNFENPRIIDLWEDDIAEMMQAGTPEDMLRERMTI